VRLLVAEVDYDGATATLGLVFAPAGIKTLAAETAGQGSETA